MEAMCMKESKQKRFFASLRSCMQGIFHPATSLLSCSSPTTTHKINKMEDLGKQRRVRFFNPKQEESSSTWEGLPLQQAAESLAFVGNKVHNWFQGQFSWQMNEIYNAQDAEFVAAVAAATLAIYSMEEAEAEYERKKREDLEMSRTKSKTRRQDTRTRQPSSGETSTRNKVEKDRRPLERAFPIRRPSRSSSVRSTSSPAALDPKQKGIAPRDRNVGTKADAWERAQMGKMIKRYEKIKSSIIAWENEKKMQAKLKMERKKSELEQRWAANQKHYQNKIERIDHTANGARAQAEEQRRKRESEIKQKAKEIQSRGKQPVKYCFCC